MYTVDMFSLLNPAGTVALDERALMFHATLLMLIVVVPVFILAFAIAYRYRAGNKRAVYTPDWEHSKMEELIWWAIPIEIILVLGALTFSSTHQLDPYKPLANASSEAPMVIEAVALNWKWLFIYPELGVASVNELALPVNRQVKFKITSDAPMNSFWIPKLGGQMYAMSGMVTTLHLDATEVGSYEGRSANYSGEKFAEMKFTALAVTQNDFNAWVSKAEASEHVLNHETYQELRAPDTSPVLLYSFVDASMFEKIVGQY